MITLLIPLETSGGPNVREHWRKRSRRGKRERAIVRTTWMAAGKPAIPDLGVVLLVRCSPRLVDTDNLAGRLKTVRDEIAAIAGVDDGPNGPLTWLYDQEKSKRPAVRIQIYGRGELVNP